MQKQVHFRLKDLHCLPYSKPGAKNFRLKDLHFLPYLIVLFQGRLNRYVVCLSSLTDASNPRNDGSRVFSVAYSKRLVQKISD